jgi:hypothetical protein
MPELDADLTEFVRQPEKLDNQLFRTHLCNLLNVHSIDTATNVPDYMLAEHVIATLKALGDTVEAVSEWHRGPAAPSAGVSEPAGGAE